MQVRLLVSRAGANFSQSAGETVDLPEGEAVRMIEAGQAEPVRGETVERAVAKTRAEKAVK
jgi:hypothetical protein